MYKPVVKPPLIPEAMGLIATMSPFISKTSGSRVQMVGSHKSQSISPLAPDIPRVLHGFETQLADYIFNIKMDCDAIVRNVIRKFSLSNRGRGNKTPVTTIIYQNQATGEYDSIDVFENMSYHTTFATKLIIADFVHRLRRGDTIPAGTILAQSPNVHEGGIWSNTLNANVLYAPAPSAVEDGFCISQDFAERCRPLEVGSVVASWGRKYYPLNLYGDDTIYKAFPDVGEKVRDDGMIFALRAFDPLYDAANMTPKALRHVDTIHDLCEYGRAGATVYDIIVESGAEYTRNKVLTPTGMGDQADKYARVAHSYYGDIIATYNEIIKSDKGVALGNNFHQLVVRAYADEPNKVPHLYSGPTIRKAFRNVPIDEYRVEVKYEYRRPVTNGSKLTDNFGTKGVACEVRPTHLMPYDKNGNRVDLIKYQKAGISRLNGGQFMEHFVTAASRDMSIRLVELANNGTPLLEVWTHLMRYYAAASPPQHQMMLENYLTDEDKIRHVNTVLEGGIYLQIAAHDPDIGEVLYDRIMEVIQPLYDSIYWPNDDGSIDLTHDKMMIGQQQIMVLEKVDYKSMSISTDRAQHHGLLSSGNRAIRNSFSSKKKSTKANGESEVRLYVSSMGGETLARLLSLANDPNMIDRAVRSIVTAPKPSNIDSIMDWKKYPLGGNRALNYVTSLLDCQNIKLVKRPQSTSYLDQ